MKFNYTFSKKHLLLLPRLLLLLALASSPNWLSAQIAMTQVGQPLNVEYDLSQAVDDIAAAYDVSIVYDVDQLEHVKVSTWEISQRTADADLRAVLKNTGFGFQKISETTFVIKQNKSMRSQSASTSAAPVAAPIQSVNVRGIIIDDETEEALIGVNILVKGGTTGTVSDIDGNFYITVDRGETLVFSYLGYLNQEITIESGNLGTVRMESNAKQLDEVVVIGYGTSKRSDLTGALSSVSEKELKQLPNTGLDQALQGRAAGVYVTQNSGSPGGGISIRIRGIGSTLTAEPLYVIDGIPVVNDNQGSSSNFEELDGGGQNSNALNTINPSDIESIEILKDASATAIYGARAANGVVLITTYSGYDPEVGSYNQNPLINGVDNGRYPIGRSFTFGLNANF